MSNEFENSKLYHETIPYISNYYNVIEVLKQVEDEKLHLKKTHALLKSENEKIIKRFYKSYTSSLSNSVISDSENYKNSEGKDPYGMEILEEIISNPKVPINNNKVYDKDVTGIQANMFSVDSTGTYAKFYEKLNFTSITGWNIVKNHLLWIPSFHTQFRDILLYNKRNEIYDPNKKTSVMSIDGEDYIPKAFDSYYGSCSIPSVFGEIKLPSLVYHCSVPAGEEIYILGGMLPSYRYDEERPNLDNFEVTGLNDLPPPFLPQIVNNPAFFSNPFIFVVNVLTSNVRMHKFGGDIPPPMIGMSGTLLTDRYIFFYGGLEIRTESSYSELTQKTTIKKRGIFCDVGFILDTVKLRFTKIKIGLRQYKNQHFCQVYPRFGHLQVTVRDEDTSNHTTPRCYRQSSYYDGSKNDNTTKDHSNKTPGFKDYQTKSNDSQTSFTESNGNSDNNSNQLYVFSSTTYIFGGYRRSGKSGYQALNDMWKIKVPIHYRGKGGLCIFGESAFATGIHGATAEYINCSQKPIFGVEIPYERAFMSYCIYNDKPGSNYTNFEVDLLENLNKNFKIALSKPLKKRVLHVDADDDSMENINRDDSRRLSSSGFYTNRLPTTSVPNKTLIMHGGSNDCHVYDDMWWFDLKTEKWKKVDTYVNVKQDKTKSYHEPKPLHLKLVGHTMQNIGSLVSMGGGMLQSDVDALYKTSNTKNSGTFAPIQGVPIGAHVFRTIDIRTQFIINREAIFAPSDTKFQVPLTSTDPLAIHGLMMIVGSTIERAAGKYVMIGGITSRRSNIKNFYLRGTLLYITVPTVTLYGL
ncbi:similar to Saccharomyces cerevisiae YAL056W GPB2 Multistep regulator of cAMP-PKA signaling [Maudiozyma saulgeensis]|uniref:Similar to Saccharomyces cerevisiae YAL056W GPB2 Multistep regulator of cAMP-PKA signaling n=1 Tax=Maudiozyma saulgeensis TaxID=1789683 RepID=A0A1X7QZ88_9SACH|nr:similar to Saccharomyces cerevisiae YAL056W GPB2 Multistep regulator of cAMP-PKA signaling [Kazachstania saulgeensis]